MNTIFREYDIRGIYEEELNEKTVKLIGFHLGQKIVKFGKHVAIGYDARTHSKTLFNYLVSGLNAADVKVYGLGMVTTPIVYFSHYQEFDGVKPAATIMITGSHNPSEYNGFKITLNYEPFFSKDLYSLGEEVLNSKEVVLDNFDAIEVDMKSKYVDYMVNQFAHLKGLKKKIVYDCGNGVADVVLGGIFRCLEIDATGIFTNPDGNFPNHHPDPSVEENLLDVKDKLAQGYDFAFAYDGDADRVAVLTPKGNIKGDMLALLYAQKMDKPIVIGEVKCSQLMYDELEKMGAKGVMYKTGHSNLKVKIRELDADLAAEVSGHIFFNDRYFGFDDATYATLRFLELVNDGIDPDEYLEKLPKLYSTDELKVKTTEDDKFKIMKKLSLRLKNPPEYFPKIRDIIDIDGVRVVFEDGWGLVRASNTTPVLVTRFEASSKENMELIQESLNKMINEVMKEL